MKNDQVTGSVTIRKCTRMSATVVPPVLALLGMLILSPLISYRSSLLYGQTETATISGLVTDESGAVVPAAEVMLTNVLQGIATTGKTNNAGLYIFPSVQPGMYQLKVTKPGFKQVDILSLIVNVEDHIQQNVPLRVGSVSESVTVEANGLNVNTTDASVSTVVDRKFVENMPLNGRSFQSLLTLVPGVTQVPGASVGSTGEITVNGQRTEANSFVVDGVSANTGTVPTNFVTGAGFAGATPGETVLGTTQSLVPIDALQEFRATTSTYSAEYGRTPGGQFSFTTRSGSNDWHGTAFEYFRNDVLDANDWFNNFFGLPKPAERQNDFGGTLGGPITIPGLYHGKAKTFFFLSYEGLRLLTPQPLTQWVVPDSTLRQTAPAALQPFLNAFPIPNGGEDGLNDAQAFYNQSISFPSSLGNIGIRVDHNFGDKFRVFGRFSDSTSDTSTYASIGGAGKSTQVIDAKTLTLGATNAVTSAQTNEVRFNITQSNSTLRLRSTNAGGATPFDVTTLLGPDGKPFSTSGTEVDFCLCYGAAGSQTLFFANNINAQRQYNFLDTYIWQIGQHTWKFGVDWRRLSTFVTPILNDETGLFFSEASVQSNSADFAGNLPTSVFKFQPVYKNFSLFAQDEWKVTPRLTLSLGLRWDVNPAPSEATGHPPFTLDQITNFAASQLAPAGTSLWKTEWHAFAPRVGLAYQLGKTPEHETVLRTGFGVFYDMGNLNGSLGFNGVGFTSNTTYAGVPFPLTPAQLQVPPVTVAPPYAAGVWAFDPDLRMPYTLEWNVAIEQALGSKQSVTVNYVGSDSQKLLTDFEYFPEGLGNANFANPAFGPSGTPLYVISNHGSANYNALQLKYQARLLGGLQALASYTFSHSIDDASSNFQIHQLKRASSDFDVRHNFQAALTYDVPGHYSNPLAAAVLKHWGLDTRITARSGLAVNIVGRRSVDPANHNFAYYQPNLVQNVPIYLYGSAYAGGRTINYSAFTPAPLGVDGDTPRNFARGFDAVQSDLALRRDFPLHERLHLQFRAEAFNVLNHPNFGSINNFLFFGPNLFGRATGTLNSSLGGLNALYQVGGPRSLQLALKLVF